ncbi:MAG: biotin--[acetyl-CoA-carboxylase] ligase [Clostridia bacterium]|nr:biotin--[acetyl-CoA-carboxylase] ligase [Clostridia bacterium]
MKIIELDEIDSTNEYCKRVDSGDDIMVIAARQSAGRGTKGRSFSSTDGGLYVSVMRHYKNFPAAEAFKIMINHCVAICRTVESFGLNPVIRWANDVLVNGKKISGTLIENTFLGNNISRSIVGSGLNVNNALPDELKEIAISMCGALGHELPLEKVKKVLCKNLKKEFSIKDYKRYINWLGKKVFIKTEDGEYDALAIDIDEGGRLIVERERKTAAVSAAEVSLRL